MKSNPTLKVKNFIVPKRTGIILLLLFHGVGLVGFAIPVLRPYLLPFTPIHLIISAIILFAYHRDWQPTFYLFIIVTYLFGFFVEVLGTQTGFIFGNYKYSNILGISLWETPLVIGLNWLMLIYATGVCVHFFDINKRLKSIAGALIMVFMDVLIEPVAIKLNFWQWESETIPFQNFLAWGVISFILFMVFYYLPFQKRNSIALPFLIIQAFFFILLNLNF